jgi:hypothetical protein
LIDLVFVVVAFILVCGISFSCGHIAGERAERNRHRDVS